MADVGIIYDYLVYFMVIWYILWPFAIFYGHLVYIFPLWYVIAGLATLH
jgi:hypothetical protein